MKKIYTNSIKSQNESSDQDIFVHWVPLTASLMKFIQTTLYDIRLIFKIVNWLQKETIIDNIFESFAVIGYEPEFAFSESDLWFMISENIRNFDPVHIFSNERK